MLEPPVEKSRNHRDGLEWSQVFHVVSSLSVMLQSECYDLDSIRNVNDTLGEEGGNSQRTLVQAPTTQDFVRDLFSSPAQDRLKHVEMYRKSQRVRTKRLFFQFNGKPILDDQYQSYITESNSGRSQDLSYPHSEKHRDIHSH